MSGLTDRQLDALDALLFASPTMRSCEMIADLIVARTGGEQADVPWQGVGITMGSLVRKGLVVRRPGRRVLFGLTPDGAATIRAARAKAAQ